MSSITPFSLQSPAFPLSGDRASLSPTAMQSYSDDVDAVAQDFESVFLTQMLEPMFAGESASGFFGGGAAGEVYRGYLMNEYGKLIAHAGGIGIADTVKAELLKLQEA